MECQFIRTNSKKCTRKVKGREYCWQHIEQKESKIIENKETDIIENKNTTKTLCVKVENLRKHGYQSLEECLKDSNNVYVGRAGRIWITEMIDGQKTRRIFHYPGSKYGNPYKIFGTETLEMICQKYRE